MEETILIDADGDEIAFSYSWTGHLEIKMTVLGMSTFSPEEVEKLKKLLNSFEDGNN